MFCRQVYWSAITLSLGSGLSLAAPVAAEVPLRWGELRGVTNLVELITAAGATQVAAPADCLCPGYTLRTQGQAQAEVRFNDGSLARLGEEARLQFWPETRNLRLNQGTALFLIPPAQGRLLIETPNAGVGAQNTAVVVRHVPDRNLTLVMALANPPTGPVSISMGADSQEGVLYAGQMALINNDGLQVVEFDLQEFYRTSRLLQGLGEGQVGSMQGSDDLLIRLWPSLQSAIAEQQPFTGTISILDPVLINSAQSTPTLFEESLRPTDAAQQLGEAQRPATLPPGVVAPLPDMSPPAEAPPSPQGEPPVGVAGSPPPEAIPATPPSPDPGSPPTP